jgi:glycosyltransferase involved in cell wall biosynthesis
MSGPDVSVVIVTYNRCDMLPRALESVLGQDVAEVQYEVIVVDNNSTDRTREVVATLIAGGEPRLRYVFEGKQGQAHARNAGIAATVAPIIAFTDDDVRVAPTWIAEIRRAFGEHPEVDCVGGRIVPQWPREAPAWLTREHWVGPLALQDYGPSPFHGNAERPLFLASANAAFRRSVFEQIGGFDPAFSKGGDHSDTEILVRLYASHLQSLYVPSIVVTAEVQPERLRKRYHRSWFYRAGRTHALMRFLEIFGRDGRLDEKLVVMETLFGTPAFVYRGLLTEGARWVGALARRQESVALAHENQLRYRVGYIRERYQLTKGERSRWWGAEVWACVLSVLRRKLLTRRR